MSDSEKTKKIFAKNLLKYMERHNLNQTDISEITGVSQQSVSNWLNAKLMPRMVIIEILAEYFKILKSDLLEEKQNSTYIPDHFESVTDAMEFILRVPVVANNCGYDLDTMSEEEIIEMAEDLSEMLQIMAKKHRKK